MSAYALVTGASSGIGQELARSCARRGIPVILVARRKEALKLLARELEQTSGLQAQAVVLDLSVPGSAQLLYDRCLQEGWEVDYLMNNAGFGDYGLFEHSSPERIRQMMVLNMETLTLLTRLFGADMRRRGRGRILQVASTAAFQPGPYLAVYSATKAYVLSFSEALAEEFRGTGVTVTALCPGATRSEFSVAASMQDSRLFHQKHLPEAREVAEFGMRSLLSGKVLAIHGPGNALMAASVRFVPRVLVRRIARRVLGPR